MGPTDVAKYLVVGQGTIRMAHFVEQKRTRILVAWRNSKRTMVRSVKVVHSVTEWLENPNQNVLPLDVYNSLEGLVDRRLSECIQTLRNYRTNEQTEVR